MAPLRRPSRFRGGSGAFFCGRGGRQRRWPAGSGHREWRCRHRVDPAGPGRWHLPGRPRRGGGSGSCLSHGGRLQWRWPAGSGHGECRCRHRVDPAGPGRWHLRRPPQTLGWERHPASVTVGDFNGDGRLDLATANADANTVSILINDTSGVVVNDFVTFDPLRLHLHLYVRIPPGVPQALWGSFALRPG